MDRWFKKDWFLRGVALLVSLAVWGAASDLSPFKASHRQEIDDLPIGADYDRERFELLQLSPERVNLTVIRPGQGEDFSEEDLKSRLVAYVDLTNRGSGWQQVEVQVRGLPPRFSFDKAFPNKVSVLLEGKIAREMSVKPEIVGLPSGYTVNRVLLQPDRVYVRGAASIINRLVTVKAVIPFSSSRRSDDKQVISLQAVDENGELVNKVSLSPPEVRVSVDLKEPHRDLPIRAIVAFAPPPGLAVEKIIPQSEKVRVYGPLDQLKELPPFVPINLDLSNVRESTQMMIPISGLGEGLRYQPEELGVQIKLVDASQKIFRNVKGLFVGKPNGNSLRLGSSGEVANSFYLNVVLSGAPKVLQNVVARDIKAYADVSGLEEGTHNVPIMLEAPSLTQALSKDPAYLQVQISS